MKIRPVGAELLHADRRKDWRDEANGRFSQIFVKRLNIKGACPLLHLCKLQLSHMQYNNYTISHGAANVR